MKRTAVVSGLGPNGMLAAVRLHAEGFHVTAVEQRPAYSRSIHLCLRQSWLDEVRELDSELARKLAPLAHRIEEPEQPQPSAPMPSLRETPLLRQLAAAPEFHIRLDELERELRAHLATLSDVEVLAPCELQVQGVERFSMRCLPASGGVPKHLTAELIVVAEGGKSPTAAALGKRPVKLSAPRFYISVHVDWSLGARNRRVDTQYQGAPVSFWAVGHADPKRGTWLVLEIPEPLHAGRGSQSFDVGYFEWAARELLGLARAPELSATGLKGTFRFEQQLLREPVAGANLVFLGDAAGMGHHALASGLVVGNHDGRALSSLVRGQLTLAGYAQSVLEARIDVLALGMPEYTPQQRRADISTLVRTAVARSEEPGFDARRWLEACLTAQPIGT